MKFKKNHVPWNKGMKGFKHEGTFKKGRVVPESICKAISLGNKGKSKPLLSKALKGHHNSPGTEIKKNQHLSKNTEFKKGNIPWNKKLNENKIIKLYNLGEEIKNLSKKFNCHFGTIYYILKKSNVKLREKSYGENHPCWQGGKSFEPYDKHFNDKFKRSIRKRDNQICMLCGIHKEKLKRTLEVHHINYDKLLSIPENCISLCKSCHPKTNFNRKYWIEFFQGLLSERYNYNYLNKEIVIQVGV